MGRIWDTFQGKRKGEPNSYLEYEERVNPRLAEAKAKALDAKARIAEARRPIIRERRGGDRRNVIQRYGRSRLPPIGMRGRRGGGYNYQGKKGYASRGRPRGSYKYFIPGKGPVSVFEWRRYMSQLRQQNMQQFQQPGTMQQGMQPTYTQQFQQQFPTARDVQPMAPANIPQPMFEQQPREIHVWESNPLDLSGPTLASGDNVFIETDLFSGKQRLRKQGDLM